MHQNILLWDASIRIYVAGRALFEISRRSSQVVQFEKIQVPRFLNWIGEVETLKFKMKISNLNVKATEDNQRSFCRFGSFRNCKTWNEPLYISEERIQITQFKQMVFKVKNPMLSIQWYLIILKVLLYSLF